MNEIVKTNKFLKKAVLHKCTKNPKKTPNNMKTPMKIDKVVTFVDNKKRNNNDNNKFHKRHLTLVTARKP